VPLPGHRWLLLHARHLHLPRRLLSNHRLLAGCHGASRGLALNGCLHALHRRLLLLVGLRLLLWRHLHWGLLLSSICRHTHVLHHVLLLHRVHHRPT
jgi:hypothetical protein